MKFSWSLILAALAATTTAHMNLADPPPLRYKGNPNAKATGDIDSDITSPNTAATYPCKGALSVLDGDGGKPVATWTAGSQQTIKIEGGASHNGGSCQVSMSYDKGNTFTVIYSKIGDCPTNPSLNFTVPTDAPAGDRVLLAWSWINHTGNREFYMNCASLTVTASKKRDVGKRETAFSARPQIFVANLQKTEGTACTKEGTDPIYPEPGPDVDNVSTSAAPPIDCETQEPITSGSSEGTGGGSGSSSSSGLSSSAASATPSTTSITGGVFVTTPPSATATAAPTTLKTSTTSVKSAATTAVASKTTSAALPSGTSSAGGQLSGSCTNEGAYNCIGGSSFQRCASGEWSTVMPMAAGTNCSPGISSSLFARNKRRNMPVRRGVSAWEQQ